MTPEQATPEHIPAADDLRQLARAQKLARRIRANRDLGLPVTVQAYIWPSPCSHRMRRIPPHEPGS